MLHFKQKTDSTCGAAAFRMIVSKKEVISEKQAVDEVKTNKSGTDSTDVLNALKNRGFDVHLIKLNVDYLDYARWLYLNSKNRLIYLVCKYNDIAGGNGGGRDRIRNHAVAVHNGFIYDSGCDSPIPVDCYITTLNRKIYLDHMILMDN